MPRIFYRLAYRYAPVIAAESPVVFLLDMRDPLSMTIAERASSSGGEVVGPDRP